MSGKFTSLFAACAVTFAVFAATAPAVAKQGPITVTATDKEIPVQHVSYRDLNVAELKEENVLVKRVRLAAKGVCSVSVPSGKAHEFAYLQCRTQALQGAEPQIDRAVTRAREIATNGWSAIAPVAITISVR
ncbi:MAG: UrcA family protein [Pseudomonadota bacterium]|nr:UrcA family protein [Pseudomonadota bacterium]